MQPRRALEPTPPRDAVLTELSKILASVQFAASDRLAAFLRYVVEKTVNGQTEDIKEYTVAVEVFGRPESFDPRLDTIVRVQASKLRSKLKEYYAADGRQSAVTIELPRGTYVPVFHTDEKAAAPAVTANKRIDIRMVAVLACGAVLLGWPLARLVNRAAPVQRRAPSIAVLPFADMSPNKDQEYFCDGITEELINALARIEGLHVVARTSAFEFKGRAFDIRKIGAQLNVQTVLEGSIRREGDKLRITVQLNGVPDGYHLWSTAYDRPAKDVLAVQEEIARAVANTLKVKLGVEEGRLAKPSAANPEALNLYLLGQYHLNRRPARDELNSAIAFFEKAIAADPNYAPAYAGLAQSFLQLVVWDHRPPREVIPAAKDYVLKALAIDDGLADAHVTRAGIAAAYDYDSRTAFSESQRALELNPGTPNPHMSLAVLFEASGRLKEAMAEFKTAADLDPLSIGIGSDLGRLLIRRGDHTRGLEQLQRMLELDPRSIRVLSYMADALQDRGMHAQAIGTLEKAEALAPDYPRVLGLLGYAYAVAGNRSAALQKLERLNDLRAKQYVPFVDIAIIHAGLGDKDLALQWLEKAYEERYPLHLYFMLTHAFDPIRSDPRFGALMKRLGW